MLFRKQKTKILVLDDAEIAFAKLNKQLGDPSFNTQLFWVKTVEDALRTLKNGNIDIVLVDNLLAHGKTGFDLLCNDEFKALDVPAVFIAGHGDEYTAVKALKAGAYDYLVKERYDSSRLLYAIHEAIKANHYKKKTAQHHIELVRLAITDDLTCLYNRRHFMKVLDNELARFARYKTPFSLLLMDVDHFKKINDENGHDAGDYVLKELGRILISSIRTTDTVARFGGEEFVIAFPNTNLEGAERFADRLRTLVERHHFYYEHTHIPVTVSVGVAEAYPEINHADTLLKLADKALYTAKKDGRNRVISYRYGSGI